MEPKRVVNWELWVSTITVALTVLLMIAYYSRWFSFAATVGPFRIIHYIAFVGTLYIAFGVILFAILKRRKPSKYRSLLRVHTLGNLISFLLVSLHFAGQVGRPASSYPEFGTGLSLYIGMVALVVTGLVFRFNLFRSVSPGTNRLIHAGLAIGFYLIIGVHILHGLNII